MAAHHIMPVVAAAATEIVIGMLWYSDHLFGPKWKKLGGKLGAPKNLHQNLALHAVASLIAASALVIAIRVFQKAQATAYSKEGVGQIFNMLLDQPTTNLTVVCAMKTAAFIWLGFLAPSAAICTIWSGGNWHKFLIKSSGQLVALLGMAAVIASVA